MPKVLMKLSRMIILNLNKTSWRRITMKMINPTRNNRKILRTLHLLNLRKMLKKNLVKKRNK